jgi:hypothetical protein
VTSATEPTRSAGPAHPTRPDYDGRSFRAEGAGNAAPVGHYSQDGDLVWAEFAGPGVRAGRLVGSCRPDGVIDAAYCLVTAAGDTVAGKCLSTPEVLADGRVRLTENWRRMDGSTGVSHIEEIRG